MKLFFVLNFNRRGISKKGRELCASPESEASTFQPQSEPLYNGQWPFYTQHKMLKFFAFTNVLAIDLNKASVKTRFKDFLKSWGVYIALFFVFYFAMQAFQSRNAPKSGPAPDINAFDVNNEPVNLQNYQGQATLIYFWATWCNICSLTRDSIYNISTDHPVITIANQSGDNEQIYAYQKKHQFNVTVINDEEGLISQTYGVYGLPTMFILDKNGEISDVEIGLSSEWGLRVRLWWASL